MVKTNLERIFLDRGKDESWNESSKTNLLYRRIHVTAGGPTVAFSLKISNFCTLVQRISTIVLMCGTKFVPVTRIPGYRYRAPISVIVNYLNDTTVGQYRLTL